MLIRCALLAALALATIGAGVACDRTRSGPPPPPSTSVPRTIDLRHDGGTLRVELALSAPDRATGLSNRDSLPPDAGMLFVFERPRIPSFWMKNTRIPLDMIWIGTDKRIVEVDAHVQPEPGVADADLRRYGPEVAVAYGLELNAGRAEQLGLRPGSQLSFELPED